MPVGAHLGRSLPGAGALLRRNAVYRRLWLAQAGSWFGDYVNSVALATTTLALTHSPAAMGLVLLCRGLPGLVVGPLIGPAIDRWPKRLVLCATDLGRAVLALGFVAAFASREVWLVYLAAGLLGIGSTLFAPAQAAAVRQVVPLAELVHANAALTATAGLVAVFGAALGGLLAAWLGPDLAFAVNAASYLWSAAWIFTADWPEARATAAGGETYPERLRAGAYALARDRVALAAALASIGFALTAGPYFVAPPVLGDLVYGMGSLGIGLVYAADGVGFIVSSVVVQGLVGRDPVRLRRLYGASYLVQAVFLTLFCLSTRLWQGMAAILVSQVAAGSILTITSTLLQTRTDAAVQGRVFAFQGSVGGGAAQLSIAAAGWVMAHFGVGAVGVPVGIVCALSALTWLALTSDAAMVAGAAP